VLSVISDELPLERYGSVVCISYIWGEEYLNESCFMRDFLRFWYAVLQQVVSVLQQKKTHVLSLALNVTVRVVARSQMGTVQGLQKLRGEDCSGSWLLLSVQNLFLVLLTAPR